MNYKINIFYKYQILI